MQMQHTVPREIILPQTFPHFRQLWDRGEDIRRLQKFLNDQGFILAHSGAGSPGHETIVFGRRTLAALIRFQKAHGIPPTGYFGLKTKASANQSYGL